MKKWCFIVFVIVVVAACHDGSQKSYWDNGKLKSELHYVDGRLDGICTWYDSNGQKRDIPLLERKKGIKKYNFSL